MPACTSSLSPRRVASAPAAEQWSAICWTTWRPPLAINDGGLAGPVECRGPAAGPSQHEDRGRESGQIDLDGARPEVDVVTEEDGRLVAVDRAPDVGQDADVVERGQVLRAQAQPLPRPHADPRRAQHVLGRLPETEVGGQREGDQQVREPDPGVPHGEIVPSVPNRPPGNGVNAS